MGDYTPMEARIYSCPPQKVPLIRAILEQHGLGEDWDNPDDTSRLLLAHTYGQHEARPDESEEVVREMVAVAPEIAVEAWTSPKYDFLGAYIAYEPTLGLFQADCDDSGEPHFTATEIRTMIGSQSLDKLTGAAWKDAFDILAKQNEGQSLDATPLEPGDDDWQDALDELVHEQASQIASDAINSGDQIDFLLGHGWTLSQIAERLSAS